jgi:hypothetical protein
MRFRPLTLFTLVVLFFLLSLIGILHHEIWLDEAHHFLLSKASSGVSDLAYRARYEGHPLLWDTLVLWLTRFSGSVFSMQLLHILISTPSAFLILRYAPFSKIVKLGFVFGYYFLYEYNIISRNYAISILFIVTTCILLSAEKKNYLAIAFSLVLLANTHLFSFFMACAFGLVLIPQFWSSWKENTGRPALIAGSIVIAAGFLLATSQIMPPADHFLYKLNPTPYFSAKGIGKFMSVPWKGLFHMPDPFGTNHWNSDFLVAFSPAAASLATLLVFLIPAWIFKRNPYSLIVFYFTSCAVMLFIYLSPLLVAVRHCGFIFLAYFAALWIRNLKQVPERSSWITRLPLPSAPAFEKVFTGAMLIFQLIAVIMLYIRDYNQPFSEAKNLAAYIQDKYPSTAEVAVSCHSSGPAVSAYLGRNLFYPEENCQSSYCSWNTRPFMISNTILLERIARERGKNPEGPFVLALNFCLQDSLHRTPGAYTYSDSLIRLKYIRAFDHSMVKSENYYLYEVETNSK